MLICHFFFGINPSKCQENCDIQLYLFFNINDGGCVIFHGFLILFFLFTTKHIFFLCQVSKIIDLPFLSETLRNLNHI